jgi:ribosomal protein L40E
MNFTRICTECHDEAPMGWDKCRSCIAKDGAKWREANKKAGRPNVIVIPLWKAQEEVKTP